MGSIKARQRRSTAPANGFTLIEVAVAAAIGAFLVSTFFVVLIGQQRSNRFLANSQTARDNANRINYLITTESSESYLVGRVATATTCTAGGSSITIPVNSIAFTIPKPDGSFQSTTGTITNVATVYYYNKVTSGRTDLYRCGPSISQNGSLVSGSPSVFNAYVEGLISENTSIDPSITCNSVSSGSSAATGREVAYQLTMIDPSYNGGAAYSPPCVIARAKAYRVTDPALP